MWCITCADLRQENNWRVDAGIDPAPLEFRQNSVQSTPLMTNSKIDASGISQVPRASAHLGVTGFGRLASRAPLQLGQPWLLLQLPALDATETSHVFSRWTEPTWPACLGWPSGPTGAALVAFACISRHCCSSWASHGRDSQEETPSQNLPEPLGRITHSLHLAHWDQAHWGGSWFACGRASLPSSPRRGWRAKDSGGPARPDFQGQKVLWLRSSRLAAGVRSG